MTFCSPITMVPIYAAASMREQLQADCLHESRELVGGVLIPDLLVERCTTCKMFFQTNETDMVIAEWVSKRRETLRKERRYEKQSGANSDGNTDMRNL